MIIKFGIAENYVPNWGVTQAIREIYQNFIDYGEYIAAMDKASSAITSVVISNEYDPETLEFLKIGFTKKSGNQSIGGHGEGMKLAGLVMLRNNLKFSIICNLGTLTPCWYEDENIGKCYGLKLNSKDEFKSNKFIIDFESEPEDIKCFSDSIITKDDIVSKSYCGSVVNRSKGNVYIGGLFVCNVPELKFAYNFNPDLVKVGRDREIPSSFDIKYYAEKILNSSEQKDVPLSAKDVNASEFNFASSFPDRIAEKFKPTIVDNKMALQAGKTIITDSDTINKLSKNKTVADRVAKMKYTIVRKKSPNTILLEFRKGLSVNAGKQAEFEVILRQSKNWRIK